MTTDRTPSPVREGNTESGNLESDWLPSVRNFFIFFFGTWRCSRCLNFLHFFPHGTWHPSVHSIFLFFFFSLRKLGIQVSASLFFQNVILFIMMNQLAVITGRTRYEMGTLSQGTWNLIGFQGVRNFVPWPTETQLCT